MLVLLAVVLYATTSCKVEAAAIGTTSDLVPEENHWWFHGLFPSWREVDKEIKDARSNRKSGFQPYRAGYGHFSGR